jgi:hypothetical protein
VSLRPLFIFSGPRSGSTLVQRILASHSQVATASEPWVLLPLLAPLYNRLPAPGPRDPLVRDAVEDFVAQLPRGRDDYRSAAREMALSLYAKAAQRDVAYFVDKTPPYHLIVDEVVETFPEGRFVFLFRNPLSVVASAVELFDAGRWEVTRYHMALFQSVADLVPASRRHADRAMTVRFEDLVDGDTAPWRRLVDYLGLPWEPAMLDSFAQVQLRGRKGDQTGTRHYTALSTEPLEKWRSSLNNHVRRAWCERYLRWIGEERLATMGYDLGELLEQLGSMRLDRGGNWGDAGRLATSLVRELAKPRLPVFAGRTSVWRALLRS